MYVALTRGRRTVWLGACRTRMLSGQLVRQGVSQFVDEIDESCLLRADADQAFGGGYRRDLDDWDEPGSDAGEVFEYATEDEFSQAECELAEGVRVVHAVYGHGTITGVQGSGHTAKIQVRFERSGDRLLVAEHAGLQVVPR